MPAYIVGHLKVWDPSWVPEYLPKVTALIESHGGRFLVRGGEPERIEGTADTPQAAIVIEFPTREAAMAFWNDPAFVPLVALRNTGSSLEAMLLDGLAE